MMNGSYKGSESNKVTYEKYLNGRFNSKYEKYIINTLPNIRKENIKSIIIAVINNMVRQLV